MQESLCRAICLWSESVQGGSGDGSGASGPQQSKRPWPAQRPLRLLVVFLSSASPCGYRHSPLLSLNTRRRAGCSQVRLSGEITQVHMAKCVSPYCVFRSVL